MNTVGFIGLGNMGGGMAKNLLSAKYDVIAFDINESKSSDLLNLGLKITSTVGKVAENCTVVILCLPNPDISREVIFNQLFTDKAITSIIIETSTLTPEIVAEFAKHLSERGKKFLSAPMVGGKSHAAEGKIDFLLEGDQTLFEENNELFEAMGKARYMGEIPSATLAKLTFNLCRYANLAIAVEAYRILQIYGANTKAIHEFISEQSLDNFGQVWGEDMKDMMTNNTLFKPSLVPKKDLTLLSEMAENHGIDKSLIDAIKDTYLSME